MSDIVEKLRERIEMRAGTADSNVNVARPDIDVRGLISDAIYEILRLRADIASLRAIAGPISIESGLSLSDIKASLRP